MDRDLLRQSLTYHGESLLSLLTCEQNENPDFIAIASDLSKAACERTVADASRSTTVEQFISRKADLLFAPLWKSAVPVEDELEETSCEPFAIMPPLEQFMEVSFEERRELFFRDVERGDVIIGRINSIRDFGFFITLICTYGDIERDIEDLELTALCPIRDVPSNGNHDDPLSYYQVGDLIRAGLKDVDRYHGKLTISLHPSSLAPRLSSLKLGVISREDLPIHYCRGDRVARDSTETYERVLESSLGFANPSNVDVLLAKLGVSDTKCFSMMRGLQSKHFQEEDFAANIRKKQSASWALKCVKTGVDHFKSGRHVEAMNEYNKALEIDTNNVEALVARGALYATKGSLVKAIGDFEVALESCPTHRNAKKYLCQTLVERGGQLEDEEKLVTAEGLYRKALTLDEHFQDATEAIRKLQMRIQKSLKLKEEETAKELEKAKNVETSAEKLRKILKDEKRMKRKRKRSSSTSSTSSSSSSTSSTSSSSSSSPDQRKSKKRKRRRRHSSHADKKHDRRTSSSRRSRLSEEERLDREVDEEEDWYPEPANTSGSFINLKHPLSGLLDPALSFGSSSTADTLDDSRGRFEDDPFECGSTRPAKVREPHSDRQSRSKDRDVNGREKGPSGSHKRKHEHGLNSRPEPTLSGPEGLGPRRHSSSSMSSEYSRKSDQQGGSQASANVSRRHSERSEKEEKREARRSEGSAKDFKWPKDSSRNGRRSTEDGPKKDLPSNLQDIFNRIAQFEKEKGLKSKK